MAVEPERFFRAVRGGGLWGPTLFVFATYLLVSLLLALSFVPLLILAIPEILREGPGARGDALVAAFIPVAVLVLPPFAGVLGTFLGP